MQKYQNAPERDSGDNQGLHPRSGVGICGVDIDLNAAIASYDSDDGPSVTDRGVQATALLEKFLLEALLVVRVTAR